MARPQKTGSMTISALEQMLDTHRKKLNDLQKERMKLCESSMRWTEKS